jgi:hypothetical protein
MLIVVFLPNSSLFRYTHQDFIYCQRQACIMSPKDPFATREAEKYEKPIASRELILALIEKNGRPRWATYLYPQ